MIATLKPEEMVRPVADQIRNMAAQAEAERRIPKELFEQLVEAGLFSIYTPKQFGGQELALPEALRVVEEVSRHDGSTGWTVALGIGNSIFTSVLPEESAAKVLGGGSVLIAGAPAFTVQAARVAGGYKLTGRWPFNSGAPNATWIGTAAPVFEDGVPRMTENGPEMVFVFMPPSQVQIIDTWYVTGLRASGTQELYVDNCFVPDALSGGFAMPAGPHLKRDSVVSRFPFFSLLGIAQSPPVCLGLARRAIEEFRQLALDKESAFGPRLGEQVQTHTGIARAEGLLSSARSYWYEKVEAAWSALAAGACLSLEDRAGLRIASLVAVENCVTAADLLYRLGGSSSIFQSSPLERCWRDLHTAAQHIQVQDARWETAGRVLLGLDPATPIL